MLWVRGVLEVRQVGHAVGQLVRGQLGLGTLGVVQAGGGEIAEERSILTQGVLDTLVKARLGCPATATN